MNKLKIETFHPKFDILLRSLWGQFFDIFEKLYSYLKSEKSEILLSKSFFRRLTIVCWSEADKIVFKICR